MQVAPGSNSGMSHSQPTTPRRRTASVPGSPVQEPSVSKRMTTTQYGLTPPPESRGSVATPRGIEECRCGIALSHALGAGRLEGMAPSSISVVPLGLFMRLGEGEPQLGVGPRPQTTPPVSPVLFSVVELQLQRGPTCPRTWAVTQAECHGAGQRRSPGGGGRAAACRGDDFGTAAAEIGPKESVPKGG